MFVIRPFRGIILALALLGSAGFLSAQTNCDDTSVPTLTPPSGLIETGTLLRESACTPGAMGTRTPVILIHGLEGTASIPPSSSDLAVFENLSLYLTQQDPSFSQNYKIFTFHYLSDEYAVAQIAATLETWLDYFRQSWDPYGEGDTPFDRNIVIIGHSMGGLVARALMNANTITAGARTGQPAGEGVILAITLATPHHGTALVNSNTFRLHNESQPAWGLVLTTLDFGWAFTSCSSCETDIDFPNRGDLLSDSTYAADISASALYTGADQNLWLDDLPPTYNSKVNAYYGVLGSYNDVPTYGADNAATIDLALGTDALAAGGYASQLPSSSAGLTASELTAFHDMMRVLSIVLERIDQNSWSNNISSVANDGAVPNFSASFAGAAVAKRVSCVTSDHLDMLDGTGGNCTDQSTGSTGTLFQLVDADVESSGAPSSIAISSVTPSSTTLNQGGSAQSVMVNLARTNYTDSVTLSTSTLPSGVTATYTQPRTGNSGSITLEAASNAAVESNQTITITASGSGVSSVTSTFSLTVNKTPSFSLSASPASVTVAAGGSATYTLSVTPVEGFNQQVSLSCSGAPSAATCSVSPTPVTLDGTDVAKATVTVTTMAGSLTSLTRRLIPPGADRPLALSWFAGLLLLGMLSCLAATRRRRIRFSLLILAAMALFMISWVACGGGGGAATTPTSGTPSGTYTLTLTGSYTSSSSSLTQSTTVSLKVN